MQQCPVLGIFLANRLGMAEDWACCVVPLGSAAHCQAHPAVLAPPLPPRRYDRGNFFPGTGAVHDVGSGRGTGYSINIPWDGGGLRDGDYIAAFSRM